MTITAATVQSFSRAQVWAYITDNALPVARKRSTDDARIALIEYLESLSIESSTAPTVPTVPTAPTAPTVPTTQYSHSIVLVAILTAIWIVFTELVIPLAIGIVKLLSIGYGKAVAAYKKSKVIESIDYFPEMAEVG
jgi:hypothetical protein